MRKPITLLATCACLLIPASTAVASLSSGNPLPQASSVLTQSVVVSWSGGKWKGRSTKAFSVPAIGTGEVTCRPNTTWIRFTPSSRMDEGTMWSDVRQVKNGVLEDAVKNARVYTFSTPTSTTPSGTGASAFEGFNKDTPVENSGFGEAYGIISARKALNQPAGESPPPTAFYLTWKWSGFHSPRKARCDVKAVLTTQVGGQGQSNLPEQELTVLQQASTQLLQQPSEQLSTGLKISSKGVTDAVAASSLNLDWSGEEDIPAALGYGDNTMTVPGVGVITATCPAGIDSEASLTINTTGGATPVVDVITYQGQGTEASEEIPYFTNPYSETVGPIPLPVNGIVRFSVSGELEGPTIASGIVSSLRKTNDPNPAEDYCQIAGQALQLPEQSILKLLQ